MVALQKSISVLFLLVSAVPTSAFAKDKEPERLKPSTKWVVSYEKESCRLYRRFESGDKESELFFHFYEGSDFFGLTLAGRRFRDFGASDKVKLQFGPVEGEQVVFFHPGTVRDTIPAYIISSINYSGDDDRVSIPIQAGQQEARREAITELRVGRPLRSPVVFELGSMAKPLAAVQQCSDDMIASWGFDPKIRNTLQRVPAPTGNPGSWMRSQDYPRDMLAERQPANVNFRLNVDEGGNVTDCFIQESTKPKEFDEAVCNAMKRRGKFLPALDAEGKAVRSFWRNTILFRLAS
ncbi:MAG: TonB family protein [Sphingorhabdus sp.]